MGSDNEEVQVKSKTVHKDKGKDIEMMDTSGSDRDGDVSEDDSSDEGIASTMDEKYSLVFPSFSTSTFAFDPEKVSSSKTPLLSSRPLTNLCVETIHLRRYQLRAKLSKSSWRSTTI